jgi:uncharacterized membrane protein YkvA (DUF1232 family)
MKSRIDAGFVAKGAEQVSEDDVGRVVANAEVIGKKLSAGSAFARLLDDAKLMLSLVRDYWNREYRAVPYWVIGAAAFALLYVLAPVDLIPDAIPVIGLVDDAAVVSACLALVRQELAKYSAWKQAQKTEGVAKD